ncbi:hypothetical protein L1987_83940 [Smallanthus sonchifolius]|uniref:Uncharacterized protein n=1 Tax=Smallanthus sonchifolius TaxID=185202 RepID=A0ACB8YE06_9ASTR|nr:hypothetical protein L1987_83940 [Smallanthus sonchifolius]
MLVAEKVDPVFFEVAAKSDICPAQLCRLQDNDVSIYNTHYFRSLSIPTKQQNKTKKKPKFLSSQNLQKISSSCRFQS